MRLHNLEPIGNLRVNEQSYNHVPKLTLQGLAGFIFPRKARLALSVAYPSLKNKLRGSVLRNF